MSHFSRQAVFEFIAASFLPFWILDTVFPRTSLRIYLIGVAAVIAAAFFKGRPNFSFRDVLPHVLFVASAAFSFFLNRTHAGSLFLVQLIVVFLFFLSFVSVFRSMEDFARVIKLVVYTTAVLAFFLIVEHLFIFHTKYLSNSVLFFDPNAISGKTKVGFFLALIFPFSYGLLAEKRSWANLASLAILLFGVVYTLNRMALLMAVLTPFLFAGLYFPKKVYVKHLAVFLFLAVVVGGFGMKTYLKLKYDVVAETYLLRNQETTPVKDGVFFNFKSSRIELMKIALQGWREKPIFGHGLEAFRNGGYGHIKTRHGNMVTHNDYAQILFEMGLLGFSFFLWMSFCSVKGWAALRKEKGVDEYSWLCEAQYVAVIILFFSQTFINVFHTIPFWLLLAGSCLVMKDVENRSAA